MTPENWPLQIVATNAVAPGEAFLLSIFRDENNQQRLDVVKIVNLALAKVQP